MLLLECRTPLSVGVFYRSCGFLRAQDPAAFVQPFQNSGRPRHAEQLGCREVPDQSPARKPSSEPSVIALAMRSCRGPTPLELL
eukprot:s719_g4.t1